MVIVRWGVVLVDEGERAPWSAHGVLERGRGWREIRRKGISARCGVLSTGAAGRPESRAERPSRAVFRVLYRPQTQQPRGFQRFE